MPPIRFRQASRACYVATVLQDNDFRVFWDVNNPKVVETSASEEEYEDLKQNFPGKIENWQIMETIDVEAMR